MIYIDKIKMKKKEENPKIKTIIFDVGGVQLNYDHMRAAKPMSKLLGVPARKIAAVIGATGSKPGFTRYCEKGTSEKQYWNYAIKKLKSNKISHQKLQALWNKIFWPNKKSLKLIPKLKKHYKLGLLSNMGRGHIKHLKKTYKISKPFNVSIFSAQVGMRKPDPKIYKLILKKLKVRPKQTVFVDDIKRNINAAKKIGINGILFKNNRQLFRDLKKFGVKIK